MLPEVTNIEPELFLSLGESRGTESRDSALNHPLARQRAAGLGECPWRLREEVLTLHAFMSTSVHCSMQLTGYRQSVNWAARPG